jgi:hypothetical protein
MRVNDVIGSDWLVASDDSEAMAKWNAEYDQRFAAEWEERVGKPIRCQGWMLPHGLPPPFENWPRAGAGRRSYTITSDDVISLRRFSWH